MHSWTRTTAPEQQLAFLRSTACLSCIIGSSSTIGDGFRAPLIVHKQRGSAAEGRRDDSKRRRISTD